MTPHLTDRDMELFANDNLPPAELLAADRHLQECGQCRGALSQITLARKGMRALKKALSTDLADNHLTYEELAGCADGTEPANFSKGQSHLKSCVECRNEISQLVMLRYPESNETVPRLPDSSPTFFASLQSYFQHLVVASVAAVLLVCAGLTAWFISSKQPTNDGTLDTATIEELNREHPDSDASSDAVGAASMEVSNITVPANSVVGVSNDVTTNPIRDGAGNIGLDGSGRLVGYDNLSAKHRQLLERSLRSITLDIAPEINELKRPSGAFMGNAEGGGNTFRVDGPFGKVISTDTPTISWQALPGAETYTVEVYDAKFKKVMDSAALRSTKWSPQLPRGRTYILQVIAVKDGVEIKAPRRPAPEARFHVLDAQKFAEVESAKRSHPNANLLLGLLFAKYGLLDEAAQKFRILVKENPKSAVLRRLLEKVQAASSR